MAESAPSHHHTSHSHDIGRGTIIGTNVNVRSGPSSNADLVTKVSGGNVAIVAQKGEWYKLRFQYGSEGWVKESFVSTATNKAHSTAKMIPIKLEETPTVATVTKKSKTSAQSDSSTTRFVNLVGKEVNIRRGPSSSKSLAGKVKGGRALVVDKWDDWYKVKFQHGTVGWVRKDFLQFPDNFDFKNNKPKTVVSTKTESTVASKERKAPHNPTQENTVEDSNIGERTSTSAKTVSSESGPMTATVIGDGIPVRRGASSSNSVMARVSGGPAEIVDKRGNWLQLRFPHGTIGWVNAASVSYPGHIVKEPEPSYVATNDGSKVDRMMQEANDFKQRHVRYVYGMASRGATDCSGFVLQVFRKVGVDLPRTAREQASRGLKVSRSNLKTGDLVFFNTRGYISHVGIYLGGERFIHASSSGHVKESSLNEAYYGNRFLFGKRIISDEKVRELKLPPLGAIPTEKADQRGGDDNSVEISKNGKSDDPKPNEH